VNDDMPARCDDCESYWARRSGVMAHATAAAARERGISTNALATAVIEAVHERHLAGLSLDTG
jgi:hypothetical protein